MANHRKLTNEMATSIRHLYKDLEYTQEQLANIFCVSQSTIRQILYNVTYGDAEYNPGYIPTTPLFKYYNEHIKHHIDYHHLTYEQSFKPIDGFPHYKLCVDGAVFSDYGFHYMKIKTTINDIGYKRVDLYKDSKRTPSLLHRLIAEHFIPNPNNHQCVLHINDIKTDNRLSNLKWGTQSENRLDATRNGRFSYKIPDFTRSEIYKTITMFSNISIGEIARRFGISNRAASKIKKDYENQQNQ